MSENMTYDPLPDRKCAADEQIAAINKRLNGIMTGIYARERAGNERLSEQNKARHDHERRIAHLEGLVHRLLNMPEDCLPPSSNSDTDAIAYWKGFSDGKATSLPQYPPYSLGDDWAHIPGAEWEEITAELEAFRARQVPYDAEALENELEDLRAFKERIGIYSPWRWDDEMAEWQCERCSAVMLDNDAVQLDLEAYAHLHKVTCPWYEPQEATRPTMDSDGVLVAHDAWDAMERELEELRAFKASVPWKTLLLASDLVDVAARGDTQWVREVAAELNEWLCDNAPEDALDTYANAPKEADSE